MRGHVLCGSFLRSGSSQFFDDPPCEKNLRGLAECRHLCEKTGEVGGPSQVSATTNGSIGIPSWIPLVHFFLTNNIFKWYDSQSVDDFLSVKRPRPGLQRCGIQCGDREVKVELGTVPRP